MKKDDDRFDDVRRLLDELCVGLGFCLSPEEQQRLREMAPMSVDAFTDAVLVAEGMDPHLHKKLRRRIRDKVQRRLLS